MRFKELKEVYTVNVTMLWNVAVYVCNVGRAHISVLTKPSEELLQLLRELVGWLQDVNDEITASSVLAAGDLATLAVQYEQSQVQQLQTYRNMWYEAVQRPLVNCLRTLCGSSNDKPRSLDIRPLRL